MTSQAAATAASGAATAALSAPLVTELERTPASFLEPLAFFVSWQGVLTLAYSGFTPALVDLKQRIGAALPALPPENPGSKWPKTSLGCLREGQRLTPPQLEALCRICREDSAALQPLPPPLQQHQRQQRQLRLRVGIAQVALFECRSLERLLGCLTVALAGGWDGAGPSQEERHRVAGILAEPEAPDYWFAASRDGNREGHYRGGHPGATLVHPLLLPAALPAGTEGADSGASPSSAEDQACREALLAAVGRFRRRVDAELPGMYAWFDDASLHITLRALIN